MNTINAGNEMLPDFRMQIGFSDHVRSESAIHLTLASDMVPVWAAPNEYADAPRLSFGLKQLSKMK